MHHRLFLVALLAIGSALSFIGEPAAAGCGFCGRTEYFYYAPQPELFVDHPIVVLEPYYISEYIPCGDGYVVNQGQYRTTAALIARRRCFSDYSPKMYYK
jgi:hypothetical protein